MDEVTFSNILFNSIRVYEKGSGKRAVLKRERRSVETVKRNSDFARGEVGVK